MFWRNSLRHTRRLVCLIAAVALDYIAILLAEKMAFSLHGIVEDAGYTFNAVYVYFWIPLVFLLFLDSIHAYTRMQPVIDDVKHAFYAILYGLISCIILLYFMKVSVLASRLYVALFSGFVLCDVYVMRYAVRKFLKHYRVMMEPVVLIGAGKTAERVLEFFDGDIGYRYEVIGILDDHPISDEVVARYRLLGKLKDAERVIRASGVQTVIITTPGMEKAKLSELIARIQPYVRYVNYVPDLIGTPMGSVSIDTLFSKEILMMKIRNNLVRLHNRVLKRIFDLVLTIGGSLVLSPLLLGLLALVCIDNHGHAIFAHRRVGKGGREFLCYKFQTMVPHAQEKLQEYLAENPAARREWDESFKLTDDPRVTRLGAFLRRTSLDELPQIWNVIKGEMSLVGPRPIVRDEVPRYGGNIREYYMVPPGITGMWQVSGRSDTTYEERVEMDTWYVRNWSIWIDLMYLFKTVKAVIFCRGAY